jgi:hypothetical protein
MKGIALAAALAAAFARVLAAAPAQACDEVSDVTGYRRCSSFGQGWDVSRASPRPRARGASPPPKLPLFVELAAVMQTVDAGSLTFHDTDERSHSFGVHNPGLGMAVVYGIDLRAGFRVAGPFYGGLTTRFAFGSLPERATAIAEGVHIDLGSVLGVVGIGGLVGVALPVGSRVRVKIEAAVGGEDVGLLAIRGIRCASRPCGPDSPGAFLEPHLMLDFWLGPSWSISPFAGDDLLHANRVTLGVVSSWHWQAFDGRP